MNKPMFLLVQRTTESNDYGPDIPAYNCEFPTEKELNDIGVMMKLLAIKEWTKLPLDKWNEWPDGSARLFEMRGISVRPVRIVEEWGYFKEKKGDL